MDTSLPIPRLRLTRHSPQVSRADSYLTPIAAPYPDMNIHDNDNDDEDAESTPRMPSAPIAPDSSPRNAVQATNTPAGRLRVLLSRVANTSTTPLASTSRVPEPQTPSEPDSDLDPPYSTLATPSIARESLKELFSRALRDPGSTPRKSKLRRNSFDMSEVDASPRLERAEQERAKNKGKRRSLSDEEADHLSNVSRRSEESFRSSHAATYDALRERLARSRSMPPTPPPAQMVMDMSMPPTDDSQDTVNVFGESKRTESTPLPSSNTPMRTLQLNSQLQAQSNLLDGDSEMHKALKAIESDESGVLPNGRPLSFPSARLKPENHTPARLMSWASHSKSHSTHNLPLRRASEEYDNSSQASSSQSGADFRERQDESQRDRLHERERRWNHPQPRSPSHLVNGNGSPLHPSSRRSSGASLQSPDDGRSSRASSVSSRSEYQEHVQELDLERQKEREREWNRPNSKLSHSTSSLSIRERARTNSQPSRPDSAQSFLPPGQRGLSRHSSFNSLSSSSRAPSPTGSISGRDHDSDIKPEVVQERERNWNSPRPTWVQQPQLAQPPSPIPNSVSPSMQHHRSTTPSNSPGPQYIRQRVDSATSQKSAFLRREMNRPSASKDKTSSLKLPLLPSNAGNIIPEERSRSSSPASHSPAQADSERKLSTGFRSRFGWSFPQNRTPLPPLELDNDSESSEKPKASLTRHLSALSTTPAASLIPLRSPSKTDTISAPTSHDYEEQPRRRGHRRSLTEFNKSVGQIPPRIIEHESEECPEESPFSSLAARLITPEPGERPFPSVAQDEKVFASDDESALVTSTPTLRISPLPPADAEPTPPASPSRRRDRDLNGDSGHPPKIVAKPETPPSTPPWSLPPVFSLQTPPRQSQSLSNASKLEFKTPSPPRNMPELPEPPSFVSEQEIEVVDHTPLNFENKDNLTAMKTPRPPGAWAQTPDTQQSAHEPFVRAQSTPPGNSEASSTSAVATPLSTWPRAGSVPAPTPAPPGAWMQTPGTARRRSILKVRFDVESETTVSDNGTEPPSQEPPSFPAIGAWNASSEQSADSVSAVKAEPYSHALEDSSMESPSTPPSIPIRASRKSPSVRVVDAFGRETKQEEEPPQLSKKKSASKSSEGAAAPSTPRNKSAVKIVDAMGREVEETVEERSSESDIPMTHNEALARVKETIAHMAEDLSEVDRSCQLLATDETRVGALEDASKAARSARRKISKSLQLVKTAEGDLKSKYGPLRESMRRSRFLPTALMERRMPSNAWLFWAFIVIQLAIFLLMYRFSHLHAKRIFLTTYYDPFYADLYIYIPEADNSGHAIPFYSSWSIFSIPEIIAREGWSIIPRELWRYTSFIISRWQGQTIEVWDATAHGYAPSSWPPT